VAWGTVRIGQLKRLNDKRGQVRTTSCIRNNGSTSNFLLDVELIHRSWMYFRHNSVGRTYSLVSPLSVL